MAPSEKVLVIKRAALNEGPLFHGLNFQPQTLLRRIFTPGNLTFIPRPLAENDPSYKQIIPYVIMSCGGRILSYVRGKRAGETRLVGNRSIGIGGHINPIDDQVPLFGTDYRDVYLTALAREIEEEVHVAADHTDSIVALLNDDSNAVGKVHLGIVHHWKLDSENVEKREHMITQMEFLTPTQLESATPPLETWSALCLAAIQNITAPTTPPIKLETLF
jgi:predicted NUDIX family phosphoesterase